MTKPFLPEPTRWSDESGESATTTTTATTTAERAMGATFRRIREATQPSQVALHRLAVRRSVMPRRRIVHGVGRVVVAAALIIATGGAVGAALIGLRYVEAPRPLRRWIASPKVEESQGGRGRRGVRATIATSDQAGAPAVAPAVTPAVAPAVAPAAVPAVAPVVAPAAPLVRSLVVAPISSPDTAPSHALVEPGTGSRLSENPPSPIAPPPPARDRRRVAHPVVAPVSEPSEAAALADAFRELRSRGDASATLRLLDEYDQHFSSGGLRGEARLARAEALIALGRRWEALPLLERIEMNGGTPTRDVRITRAELLVEADRCAEAIGDFGVVLASPKHDAAAARALYGRASCLLRAGELGAARADLETYVTVFPDGASVPAARRALESIP